MLKARVPETNEGIQNHLTVGIFNEFAKNMRDKGWNNVDSFIAAGIMDGNVLEIGPGPGYIGLEWLKKSSGGTLTGIEISDEMIQQASKNAAEYGMQNRVHYEKGNCMQMPFADASFDAVISNGSLHEWEFPERTFNEICGVMFQPL